MTASLSEAMRGARELLKEYDADPYPNIESSEWLAGQLQELVEAVEREVLASSA
ncbi:hypothetical protein Q7C18_02875 [Nesterenkonia sp. CL21]|uniref:hypothetical protein n=1 Tax=Nesterenkonia sp. CL21 TaxID=3064894 RepID=UPI002878C8D1|nr:hypothetical protein [Nesterenkonia sp. CL21]MDS2171631.1 hypothetical protein [Nesterenkonia sp. CL21]